MSHTEYPSTPAFYDLSVQKSEEAPWTSPYFIRSVPVPSTDASSRPVTRSLSKRDIGTDTNIASLFMTGLTGTISIILQAKGNHIAAASLELALNVAGNAVASGMMSARTSTVSGRVNSVAGTNAGTAQVDTNDVIGGVSATTNSALSWLSSVPSILAAINPFGPSNPTAPSNHSYPDGDSESRGFDTEDVFVIGSDTDSAAGDNVDFEDEASLNILDPIAMIENPWADNDDE
jgi:hypothetical protein